MSIGDETLVDTSVIERWVRQPSSVTRSGHVTAVIGPVIRAVVPDVRMGELCRIRREGLADLPAEVVGFDRQDVLMMPLGTIEGLAAHAAVMPTGRELTVPSGPGTRGRVIDPLGRPLDGKGPLPGVQDVPQNNPPPPAMTRRPIDEPVETGVRAIDGVLTIGRGQRIGIFAAAGGGKSTLLGMITRNVKADSVIVALIGERGREVREFVEDSLGHEGLAKATVVVSTSDEPALLRLKAAYTATAIAESRRRQGEHVILMMDSVTRFARALRDVGLATGEPPGRQGYPASVFAVLPLLFERAGNDAHGAITGLYTVLVTGDDIEEPVADETMSLLDGHIILSRKVAASGRYPAIDVPRSKSRVMDKVVTREHLLAARKAAAIIETYERNYDKITIPGLYEPGSDPAVDEAIELHPSVIEFLTQDVKTGEKLDRTIEQLQQIVPAPRP